MTSTSTTARWPLGMAVLAALAGCGGGEVDNPLPTAPARAEQGPGSHAVGEYLLEVEPSKGKMTLHRLSAVALAAEAATPGLSPQTLISADLVQDGVTGSNNGSTTNSTVELVTTSTVDTYNAAAMGGCAKDSFCGNVTLNSFWTQALNFTYTQVTSIVDSTGKALGGHSGTNSDTAPASTGPLSNSLGLWQYQTAAVTSGGHFSNGNTGVVLPLAANGATRLWQFANPDDATTYVRLTVWASTAPTNYTFGSRASAYVSACTINAGESEMIMTNAYTGIIPIPQNQPIGQDAPFSVTVPFAFNFFGTSYPANSPVNFSKWGQVTFGATSSGAANMPSNTSSTTQSVADTNKGLPLTTAPRPAVFIWWDTSRWAASGDGLCAKLAGTSPNRQVHLSWTDVGFSGSGPYVDYSVTINESTDEIWLNYGPTVGGTVTTWTATVGAQNTAGTTVVPGSSGSFLTSYPANTTKVLLPIP